MRKVFVIIGEYWARLFRRACYVIEKRVEFAYWVLILWMLIYQMLRGLIPLKT